MVSALKYLLEWVVFFYLFFNELIEGNWKVKRVLRQIILHTCILGSVLGTSSSTAVSEEPTWSVWQHWNMTEEVLKDKGWKNQDAINKVIDCNIATDLFDNPGIKCRVFPKAWPRVTDVSRVKASCPNFDFHFDNLSSFQDVQKHWDDLHAWLLHVADSLKASWGETARCDWLCLMGVVLHAVQDFYCHSNWVVLVSCGGGNKSLDPADLPKWEELYDGGNYFKDVPDQWKKNHPKFNVDNAKDALNPKNPPPPPPNEKEFSSGHTGAPKPGLQTGEWPENGTKGTPWDHRHPGGRSRADNRALKKYFGNDGPEKEETAAIELAKRASCEWVQYMTSESVLGTDCSNDLLAVVQADSTLPPGPPIQDTATIARFDVVLAGLTGFLDSVEHANFVTGTDPANALFILDGIPGEGATAQFLQPSIVSWASDTTIWPRILSSSDPVDSARYFIQLQQLSLIRPIYSVVDCDVNPSIDNLTLVPGGAPITPIVTVFNDGLAGLVLDSIQIPETLNSSGLVAAHNATIGMSIPGRDSTSFTLTFNPSNVSHTEAGLRSGEIIMYLHGTSGNEDSNVTCSLNANIYVVPTFCLNRKIKIHSANNFTDVGSQGTIKDQSGQGMFYSIDQSERFYDGGVWIYNSSLRAAEGVPDVPRKVTRQLFSDNFLRCVQDIVLDSTAGTDGPTGYYNLYAVSVSTDVEDSILLFKNIWEQSTHPDSSDFLLQITKLWNISSRPVPDVAMGVLYDVDVQGGGSAAGENVGGDTSVTYNGRKFWLGWIAGNDISIDICSPNNAYYGVVVLPNGSNIGNPGDSIHPRGAVIYEQSGFSDGIGSGNTSGGDSLCQRWSRDLTVCTSTRRRQHDTLTGVWQDTAGGPPYTICGNPNTGPPYRTDMGYLAIAKRVSNYAPSAPLSALVARYGLEGAAAHLAASVDSSFPGTQSYTVIHVGSISGLTDLMTSAVKGIDWYVNHKNLQTGPYQISDDTLNQNYYEGRKGDLDYGNTMNPADVGGILSMVYAGATRINGRLIPLCVADVDGNGVVSPSDFAKVLNAVYVCNPAPCSYSPTALQQCSH